LEAAYVFGNLGNLSEALGGGWSVEEAFAWAVGDGQSDLTLPLPGDDVSYVLRLDIHPALFPPAVARQRLTIRSGDFALGSFDMAGRQTIAVALPPALTRGEQRLSLTFLHPDAARPSDYGMDEDSRDLAFCFHSAGLVPEGFEAAPSVLEAVHGLIAGGATAQQICSVIGKLRCLQGRWGVRFVDTAQQLQDATADLPPGALETSRFVWTETNTGKRATRGGMLSLLPYDCRRRTFYAPTCQALWPFHGRDSRAVPEPGRYPASRYPYGDRLAQALAGVQLGDDLLFLMYEAATNKEPLDPDALFAAEVAGWQRADAQSDVRLAAFIEARFRSDRLFLSPDRVGPVVLREMVLQVLDDPMVRDVAGPEVMVRELDTVLEGFTGRREEVPVHPRVARHFGLSWWSPDMKYRWMNNLMSHRDYILNYIKWTPWRP
jgi:hypothetical protein